jgi:hypothetical protein
LRVAPRLLEQVRPMLPGRLVSGDALYCQPGLCRQVRAVGGDYLFAIKGNQPNLLEDVALLFSDPPPGERFLTAQTVDKHGGRLEERRLRASVTLSRATSRRLAGRTLGWCWRWRRGYAGQAIPHGPRATRCATS